MFKLVSLLAAGLFLTFLIGGEDRGQTRQGLIGMAKDPVTRPIVRHAIVAPRPEPVAPTVTMVNFTPVKVQAPATARKPDSAIAGSFVLVTPEKTAAIAKVAAAPETVSDLPVMYISGLSVNVRQGPSTDYEVVGRLSRAEAVTVVSPEQDGWVQIRIEGDGLDGFIAARLLADTDPTAN